MEENLINIGESDPAPGRPVAARRFSTAEHFFDGYKANPEYAMGCLATALEAGARWVVLCDTNGGTLPLEIGTHRTRRLPGPAGRQGRHPYTQ